MSHPVLVAEGLSVRLHTGAHVIRDVSIQLRSGCILGLVGESGSGKTTVGLALLGYAAPPMIITAGSVKVGEIAILPAEEKFLRSVRGAVISHVPQDPSAALNP